MTKIEMDCNLKIGQFFEVVPVYFGEIAKKLSIVCSSQEKYLIFFLAELRAI